MADQTRPRRQPEPHTRPAAADPLPATLSVCYLGVFPTAVAFTTWAYALARTAAGTMGATTYLVPAITVLMSWVILGEVPGWLVLAGGALCLAGVALSRRGARRGATARPGHHPAVRRGNGPLLPQATDRLPVGGSSPKPGPG